MTVSRLPLVGTPVLAQREGQFYRPGHVGLIYENQVVGSVRLISLIFETDCIQVVSQAQLSADFAILDFQPVSSMLGHKHYNVVDLMLRRQSGEFEEAFAFGRAVWEANRAAQQSLCIEPHGFGD